MNVPQVGKPVAAEVGSNGSESVPTGEVWFGTINFVGQQDFSEISLNGTKLGKYGSIGESNVTVFKTVLDSGTSISTDSEASARFSGYDVSNNVDNTVVSTISRTDLTVPSGETWEVNVAWSTNNNDGELNINGTETLRIRSSSVAFEEADMILSGGDTISPTAGAFYLGGFKR